MVNLRVHDSNGQGLNINGDYRLLDGGVLAVHPEGRTPILFSPSSWLRVDVLDPNADLYGNIGCSLRDE